MSLRLAVIQNDIIPNDVQKNLDNYKKIFQNLSHKVDIILLPELFNCGISSEMTQCAENMHEKSVSFLAEMSQLYQSDIVFTLLIKKENVIVNRLIWMTPNGIEGIYDKRHLFFGDEKNICTAGSERTIITHHDWKILPLICYDVRFPIWCRNNYSTSFDYDVLLFLANFPEPRIEVLITLAQARAIENQAYVVAVNRIGKDGNGTPHNGRSVIIDPVGKIIGEAEANKETILYGELSEVYLRRVRKKLPVYLDWDKI